MHGRGLGISHGCFGLSVAQWRPCVGAFDSHIEVWGGVIGAFVIHGPDRRVSLTTLVANPSLAKRTTPTTEMEIAAM